MKGKQASSGLLKRKQSPHEHGAGSPIFQDKCLSLRLGLTFDIDEMFSFMVEHEFQVCTWTQFYAVTPLLLWLLNFLFMGWSNWWRYDCGLVLFCEGAQVIILLKRTRWLHMLSAALMRASVLLVAGYRFIPFNSVCFCRFFSSHWMHALLPVAGAHCSPARIRAVRQYVKVYGFG